MKDKNSPYQRILKAALLEFGTKGYTLASTNIIAKQAGVSKGAIFQHFISKAELFYALYMQELDLFLNEFANFKLNQALDIYEQIIDFNLWKAQYMLDHPEAASIMLEGIANPPPLIKDKLLLTIDKLRQMSITNLFSKINLENLNPNISRDEFEKNLNIAIAGLQATYIDKNINFERLSQIRQESLNFLKTVIKGMEK